MVDERLCKLKKGFYKSCKECKLDGPQCPYKNNEKKKEKKK